MAINGTISWQGDALDVELPITMEYVHIVKDRRMANGTLRRRTINVKRRWTLRDGMCDETTRGAWANNALATAPGAYVDPHGVTRSTVVVAYREEVLFRHPTSGAGTFAVEVDLEEV